MATTDVTRPDLGAVGGADHDAAPATRSSFVTRVPSWIRHAPLPRDPGDAPAQLGRVEHDVAARRPVEAGVPERGVDLGPGSVPVQELEVLPVLGRLVDPRPELVDLVGLVGQGEHAGLLEVALDAVLAGEGDEPVEVVDALALEALQLVGEVPDAVGEAVGQARLAEAAVAAGRPERDGLRLQDDDPQRRVRVGQRDRRPEAREPGADDRDVDGRGRSPRPAADRRAGPARAASS